jgi:UDP-glucose 4-epimerase
MKVNLMFTKYIIIGGAGCIGSHFVDELLLDSKIELVTIYDNLSSGRTWHYEHHLNDPRLNVIINNVENISALENAMKGHDVTMHLASNPDIAKAYIDPTIDFYQGTFLTNCVVEAMRKTNVNKLLYASGSGVYGDIGDIEAQEERGSLLPISTYGASKLAGEALIHSYCYMFGINACCFRFGNVVGSRQTHGVTLDFIKKLSKDPSKLTILGDGNQYKSYIHISDIVKAVLLANKSNKQYDVYNVATGDYITVKEIANLVVSNMKLNNVIFEYSGGNKGWKGDVAKVILNTDKIRNLGWKNILNTKEAISKSILDILKDLSKY